MKSLYQALQSIVNEVKNGHSNFSFLEKKATDKLSERDWKVDYISILDKRTLLPAQANDRELVILAAAQIGKTRLIDNIEFINEHY